MSDIKLTYTKKDPIQHILDRSDMYCGSKKPRLLNEYVAIMNSDKNFKIIKKEILCSPALIRIFLEVLSNTIDNFFRSINSKTPCTKIHINFNKETGETSVTNDGIVIPIKKNDTNDCYIHTMIFGQLLTGSNYNDDEERITSGRNGIGVKCCNVFSKEFIVNGVDSDNNLSFSQKWTNNMKNVDEPKIKILKTKKIKNYTNITYIPDFEKFELLGYSDDILALYTKYIIDAAMICKNVKIYLNDMLIPVNNLLEYSKLYMTTDEYSTEVLYIKNDNTEIVLSANETKEYQDISFVNGIYTKLGGVHVDVCQETIFRPLLLKFNKKDKPQINIRDLKQFFRLFIITKVDKPEFESQEKHKLESPTIKIEPLKQTQINKIKNWTICNNITDLIKGKELVSMKKVERKKTGFVKIEGLDPANLAGTNKSHMCTLILCEGLSAKTYAVAGIEKGINGLKGRDYFGCFPLRGKLLNTRNSNSGIISKNKEISNLIKALGLSYNVDYTLEENYKQLRYGKILIICDSDVDGIHIEGLILNTFLHLFPTLLERKEPYIVSMKTPIVRVFDKPKDILFYDENNFKEYVKNQTKKITSKYYKGLGTTKSEDVHETFGNKLINFVKDTNTEENINKVFSNKCSDLRKKWMSDYSLKDSISLDKVDKIYNMNISDFINNEMVKFSISDCKRNLPNYIDGLKESQRKILYSAKLKKLNYNSKSLKVAQFGGYVAEHSSYHHGEQNLYETIIKMANDFPGTNNIPLFYRDGQFGSRTYGGKDAANPRYIFTKLDKLTHLLFREEDDCLLEYNFDDGDKVEPKFYIPILPLILINGCTVGIGTGWSCNVPNFNPIDIINIIKLWLDDKDISDIKIIPWYKDFKGTISQISEDKYISYGNIDFKNISKKMIKVTELPIGLWTDNFKDKIEDLLQEKKIKSIKNYSSPNIVNIDIIGNDDASEFLTIDNLKLFTYLHTSNMVMFNENELITKFKNINQIIIEFCKVRLSFYEKRKKYMIDKLEHDLNILKSKHDFITNIINNTIKIMNVSEDDIIKQLIKNNYYKLDNSYDYLLKLSLKSFTSEKLLKISNDIDLILTNLNDIKNMSVKNMWLRDIKDFEKDYIV
jgi:DNA topoisomerase-2